MNVQELIDKLKSLSPDARVVVDGYEDGFDDVTDVKQVAVEPRTQKEWYNGKYEKSLQGENAVLVFSKERMRDEIPPLKKGGSGD